MKKVLLLLCVCLLTGCSSVSLEDGIPKEKFSEQTEMKQFDTAAYIESIDHIISSVDYIRIDSVFQDEDSQETVVITDQVVENVLNIYNQYVENKTTYEAINFFDLHVKNLSVSDIDILIKKIIDKVEEDYDDLNSIMADPQFKYITKDQSGRITTISLDNYEITPEALALYPDLEVYIERLNKIIKGGYQIRKISDQFYIYPDYASFLVRYDDYYSNETYTMTEFLVNSSRTPTWAGDNILITNDDMAYLISEIESRLKEYPSSSYFDMLRSRYRDYFITMITNPNNIEPSSRAYVYKTEVVRDFEDIIGRYSGTQMSRLLNQLLEAILEDSYAYNQEIIEELIMKIEASY